MSNAELRQDPRDWYMKTTTDHTVVTMCQCKIFWNKPKAHVQSFTVWFEIWQFYCTYNCKRFPNTPSIFVYRLWKIHCMPDEFSRHFLSNFNFGFFYTSMSPKKKHLFFFPKNIYLQIEEPWIESLHHHFYCISETVNLKFLEYFIKKLPTMISHNDQFSPVTLKLK